LAGMIAGALTTPFDVVKSRLMTNTLKTKSKTFRQWFVYIYKEEGILAYFKGWIPRTIYLGMNGFVYFLMYFSLLKYTKLDRTFYEIRK
jgi:solute carrier family 25 S-adenosylmethionine transporter 26